MRFSTFKECKELNLRFFECPSTLFIVTGLITILLIFITFFIARNYYSDEIVFLLSAFIAFIMLVISYFVHNGTSKVALSKRHLLKSNVQLKNAVKKLEEAKRIQQDFTHMMVHDLRSPLNGIRMVSEVILNEFKKRKITEWSEPVSLIEKNTNHMLSMVNDLLDLAKIEAGMFKLNKEKCRLNNFVGGVVDYFKQIAKSKEIRISPKIQAGLPEMTVDKKALRQVFENLISNSLKFTPPKGTIEIGAFLHLPKNDINKEAAGNQINWLLRGGDEKLSSAQKSVVISITDNGPGLSLSELSRLFNKFEQIKSARKSAEKGTGLGLVIVKGIVEAHGGTIGVASKQGVGSTFYFNLPIK